MTLRPLKTDLLRYRIAGERLLRGLDGVTFCPPMGNGPAAGVAPGRTPSISAYSSGAVTVRIEDGAAEATSTTKVKTEKKKKRMTHNKQTTNTQHIHTLTHTLNSFIHSHIHAHAHAHAHTSHTEPYTHIYTLNRGCMEDRVRGCLGLKCRVRFPGRPGPCFQARGAKHPVVWGYYVSSKHILCSSILKHLLHPHLLLV